MSKNSLHALLYCKMSITTVMMGTHLVIHLVRNNDENESNMKLNCSLLSGCEPLAMI